MLHGNQGRGIHKGLEDVGQQQMHSLALRLKMLALVHGETASSATEAVALRAKLAAVADFAVQLALVLGAVCRVEHFTAKTCNTRSLPAVGDYDASILLRLLVGGGGEEGGVGILRDVS